MAGLWETLLITILIPLTLFMSMIKLAELITLIHVIKYLTYFVWYFQIIEFFLTAREVSMDNSGIRVENKLIIFLFLYFLIYKMFNRQI